MLFAQTALSLPTEGGLDPLGVDDDWVPARVISVEKRSDPSATPGPSDGAEDWIPAEMVNRRDDSQAYSGLVSCFKAARTYSSSLPPISSAKDGHGGWILLQN